MTEAAVLVPPSSGFRQRVTPLLITYNEEANLERVLPRLAWARKIVVIDSGSDDRTRDILARHPQVQVFNRPFDSFAGQCNFGLGRVDTEWVLSLDSDYELSPELVAELDRLDPPAEVAGYFARFVYRIHGRPLRASLYPDRCVLYRVRGAAYRDEGHGHRVEIAGSTARLQAPIFHDDRKPVDRWFAAQRRYAAAEADHLLSADPASLSRVDRLRRRGWLAPFLVGPYVLIARRALLDGAAGWTYTLQRVVAEAMIALELLDRRLRRNAPGEEERGEP